MQALALRWSGLVLAVGVSAAWPTWAQPLAPDTPSLTRDAQGVLREQVEQTRSQRTERSFFPTGVMQRETVYAMEGDVPVKVREVSFSAAGVMLREQRWQAGEPVLDVVFFASGVLQSRREITGLGPTREWRVLTFFSSGILSSDERYAAPIGEAMVPIGLHKTFDASGQPLSERTYDLQGRLLSERLRGPNGQW